METLLVSHHRTHDYPSTTRSHASNGHHSSPPLRGLNCCAFQYGIGILTPPPTTRSPRVSVSPRSEPPRRSRSSPIPIPSKPFSVFDGDDGELWAGPAYSNSPPPSSLPMPKFTLCRKEIVTRPKSAPPSPSRESDAARDLRRILNLDADRE